jgi:hypothetical protein
MATIPAIEERMRAWRAKGCARTPEESVELGRLLTELKTQMPPGDFYTHLLEVLRIPSLTAQRYMRLFVTHQEEEAQPARERAGRRLPGWRRGFRRADCRRWAISCACCTSSSLESQKITPPDTRRTVTGTLSSRARRRR